jgi:hypothetical protein
LTKECLLNSIQSLKFNEHLLNKDELFENEDKEMNSQNNNNENISITKFLNEPIIEKPLNSMNGFIIKEGCPPIDIGYFDEYFMPNLSISSTPEYDNNSDNPKVVGRIVELELKYKSKEGKLSSYKLRGFASAK